MDDHPSQMMSRTFGIWQPAGSSLTEELMGFQNSRPVYSSAGAKPSRGNWNNNKRKKASASAGTLSVGAAPGALPAGGVAAGISGYGPPTLTELQHQNCLKARRFYPKKKFTRFAPFAPRNTTSFIIRAKKSGGIASLVSPCPVTPAILPTPTFSPSREGLVDMAKEEWGVDGYGSMKGLIRLRSPTAGGSRTNGGVGIEDDEDVEDGSSESDVEEHVEVERRLDHDLSRFEIVYPSFGEEQGAVTSAGYLLENRVDDQDTHIAQLEEENLILKERLFLMEREMGELRRRLLLLETDYRLNHAGNNIVNEQHGDHDDDHGDSLNEKEEALENDGGDVCSEKNLGECEESRGIRLQE